MENENHKHLGIDTNKYLSHKIYIKDATDRLNGTFLSLVHSGVLYQDNLYPLTCIKYIMPLSCPRRYMGVKTGLI